jgi:5-methylcytosine-specific restriction protein A
MSQAPMRICSEPGCPTPTRDTRCPAHTRTHIQAYDRQRGTSTERGYGARWGRYRAWFLEQWPLCGDKPDSAPQTKDSECEWLGLQVPASVVDHIIPVTGPDDPTFFRPEAHQALCSRCHDVKRQREATAARKMGTGG